MRLCPIALNPWWLVTFSSLGVSQQRVCNVQYMGLTAKAFRKSTGFAPFDIPTQIVLFGSYTNTSFSRHPYPIFLSYLYEIPILCWCGTPSSDASMLSSCLTSVHIPCVYNYLSLSLSVSLCVLYIYIPTNIPRVYSYDIPINIPQCKIKTHKHPPEYITTYPSTSLMYKTF